MIGKMIGQYEIIDQIGRGGMAIVYRALQPSINRQIAIKVFQGRPSGETVNFAARFAREAKLLATLNHRHILAIYDYGVQDDMHYIVMPYLPNGTLAKLILAERLPNERVLELISQIGQALDYAHGKGIIHRDLKPQNVLLDEEYNAVLSDFGIAKLAGVEAEQTQITGTGFSMGTPSYMSPEQWAGYPPIGPRTDIYALGVMAFEMFAGEVPFNAETPAQIMHKAIYVPMPPIALVRPDLPANIDYVLSRAAAKDPENRYPTAKAFVDELREALSNKLPTTITPTPDKSTAPFAREAFAASGQPIPRHVEEFTSPIRHDAVSVPISTQPNTDPSVPTQRQVPAKTTNPLLLAGAAAIIALLVGLIVVISGSTGNGAGSVTGQERKTANEIEQVWLQPGCFEMGVERATVSNARNEEGPAHEVCLTKGFWIDKYEVTNAQYDEFVKADGYNMQEYWSEAGWQWRQANNVTGPKDTPKFGEPNQPRIGVSWYEAEAYANWRGQRLPTEAEWEYAMRGPDKNIFPWGNAYVADSANISDQSVGGKIKTNSVPVGIYAQDKAWSGAMDGLGNVREWVADWYAAQIYREAERTDPTGPTEGTDKVARGTSWSDTPREARLTARGHFAPSSRIVTIGLRLASDR